MSLAAAVAAAAEASPMVPTTVEQSPDRVLLIDGDGLAYYCSGNEETDPGDARHRMMEKIASAKRAAGASRVLILLTSEGSHKGNRYAIATVKPYQGNRGGSDKPKNWAYLRNVLDNKAVDGAEVISTDYSEADDLFAYYSDLLDDVAILTQDKDMRMVPGLHLDWITHLSTKLDKRTFALVSKDKLYGRKWFWQQLLSGDPADNIPGLPKYIDNRNPKLPREKLIGEKTAAAFLENATNDQEAFEIVGNLYLGYYQDEWLTHLLEQASLLWLRTGPNADVLNVTAEGNPLDFIWKMNDLKENYVNACRTLASRLARVDAIQSVTRDAEDGEGDDVGEAGDEVRLVPTVADATPSSDGPQPLDGIVPSGPAPNVQRPAREDRELRVVIRRTEPLGFLAWGRALLAPPQ